MSGHAASFNELLAKIDAGSIATHGPANATPVFCSGQDNSGERNWRNAEAHRDIDPSSRYRVDDTEAGSAIEKWRRAQSGGTTAEREVLKSNEAHLWDAASRQFARRPADDVRAFVNSAGVGVQGSTNGAVFAQIALPELLANDKVHTNNGVPREQLSALYASHADHREGARAVIDVTGPRAGAVETPTAEIVAQAGRNRPALGARTGAASTEATPPRDSAPPQHRHTRRAARMTHARSGGVRWDCPTRRAKPISRRPGSRKGLD